MVTIPEVMDRNEDVRQAYSALSDLIGGLANVVIEEKKSCLHVVTGSGAFLGVHPRKSGLRLNIVLNRPISGVRVVKSEQVSANRYHNEVDFSSDFVDPELSGWIEEAYKLKVQA